MSTIENGLSGLDDSKKFLQAKFLMPDNTTLHTAVMVDDDYTVIITQEIMRKYMKEYEKANKQVKLRSKRNERTQKK